jgi:hypothetical protein
LNFSTYTTAWSTCVKCKRTWLTEWNDMLGTWGPPAGCLHKPHWFLVCLTWRKLGRHLGQPLGQIMRIWLSELLYDLPKPSTFLIQSLACSYCLLIRDGRIHGRDLSFHVEIETGEPYQQISIMHGRNRPCCYMPCPFLNSSWHELVLIWARY